MLSEALRLTRVYHGLTQTQLSYKIGLSNSFLSEIESGKKVPSLEVLNKYSEVFEIPTSSLLFFSESLEPGKITGKVRVGIAKKIVSVLKWHENRLSKALPIPE
jgi:transcriptional regulator with XRE-family HTH domain